MEKKKEVYSINREIVVDGKKSTLPVKIDFDTEKGNIRITGQITTKQLSFAPEMRSALLDQFGRMIAQAYDDSIELLEEFLRNNRPGDPGQMELPLFERLALSGGEEENDEPARDDEDSPAAADSEQADEQPKSKTRKLTVKAK